MTANTRKGIVVVDLFAGGGGATTAVVRAANDLELEITHAVAVNHWDDAIATHRANHPNVTHYCEDVGRVRPKEAVPGGVVHLLVAGPECTFFSGAAGDRVINDQSRISVFSVLDWLHDLYVHAFCVENVVDLTRWGPLNKDGRRNKKLLGQTFLAYLDMLRALGYKIDWRILKAADYGDPTSRERLFILGRRDGKPIRWPEPTHAPPERIERNERQESLFSYKFKPYRTAREIIDWSVKGHSILMEPEEAKKLGIHRPLSPNTMRRIWVGLWKFGLQPFMMGQQSGAVARSVGDSVPTLATAGAVSLVHPFVLPLEGIYRGNAARSIDDPVPSPVAERGLGYVVNPFLLNIRGGDDPYTRGGSVDETVPVLTTSPAIGLALPLPYLLHVTHNQSGDRVSSTDDLCPTITSAHELAVARPQPYLIAIDQTGSRSDQVRSADSQVPTIVGKNRVGVVQPQPWLVAFHAGEGHERRVHSVDDSLPTQDTSNRFGVADPYIVKYYSTGNATSIFEPLDTATVRDRFGLAIPYIVKFFGANDAANIDEPLDTVMGVNKYALCIPILNGYMLIDILFRMFLPREAAAAMSFPTTYVFVSAKPKKNKPISNKAMMKMVGNAWPGETGYRLAYSQLQPLAIAA